MTEEVEVKPVGYMNAGQVHEMQSNRLDYGYVYSPHRPHIGASVALYDWPAIRQIIERATLKANEARRQAQAQREADYARLMAEAKKEQRARGMAERKCRELEELLRKIADLAHMGGLVESDGFDAESQIRRLTLDHWDSAGSLADHHLRVLMAMKDDA